MLGSIVRKLSGQSPDFPATAVTRVMKVGRLLCMSGEESIPPLESTAANLYDIIF